MYQAGQAEIYSCHKGRKILCYFKDKLFEATNNCFG